MSWTTIGLVVLGILLLVPLVIAVMLAQHKHLGHSPPGPMLVIAVYGIAFAIAIPAWQDWKTRDRVAESLRTADRARASVEAAMREHGKPPAALQPAAGVSYDPRDGSLSIQLAPDVLEGQRIRLAPSAGPDRRVTWKCVPEREPGRFGKFMPKECR